MKIVALFIIVAVVSCVSGCVQLTEADEKCGPEKSWFSTLKYVNGDTAKGLRTIVLVADTEPEDICTVEHIKPTFFVLHLAGVVFPADFQFTAAVSVPGFTPRT